MSEIIKAGGLFFPQRETNAQRNKNFIPISTRTVITSRQKKHGSCHIKSHLRCPRKKDPKPANVSSKLTNTDKRRAVRHSVNVQKMFLTF